MKKSRKRQNWHSPSLANPPARAHIPPLRESDRYQSHASAGDDTPSPAPNRLHHLALLCEAQEKYSEADQLYQRVLTIRRKMMGRDNPRVLLTEKHYATLLRKMGRREEAVQLEAHMKTIQGNHENL